jgi:hypothetical protein
LDCRLFVENGSARLQRSEGFALSNSILNNVFSELVIYLWDKKPVANSEEFPKHDAT